MDCNSLFLCFGLFQSTTAGMVNTDDPVHAARDLLSRILPAYKDSFIFETIPSAAGQDIFEIASHHKQIVIRGNTAVSMAMGLNWYLKYYCFCDISLFGNQLSMPGTLPVVPVKIRKVSPYKYRYMLNYCSFGYTMSWWDWSQWEKLIDWMALNGINMPLSVTGQEGVWRAVGNRLGISDLSDFLAGPPYLPFGWMGCLDGWGGPLPESWIDAHINLQKKILARERGLGMSPVLQGFTGHIPPAVIKKLPGCTVQKIHWIEWETYMLDPLDPLFQKLGKLFNQEQTKLYGSNHLYAADSFIEMTPPKGDSEYLEAMAKSILEGMTAEDPDAIWILQGWAFSNKRDFWTSQRLETFLTAIPNNHIVVLDLFCEQTEMWRETKSFYGKPWLWCMVQTFGANTDMHGPLNKMNLRIEAARESPYRGNLSGIGFVNEGFEGNPVIYEFLTEMAWHTQAVDLSNWLDDYSKARYGVQNDNLNKAWQKLYQSVYSDSLNYGIFISANRYPRLRIGNGPSYDTKHLIEAWRLLLNAADLVEKCDTYAYDLTSVGIQVMANHSNTLHKALLQAYNDENFQKFKKISQLFLQLLGDLDDLAATQPEFLLGRWLENAKRWGTNEAEKALYEWNARRVLTSWGSGANLRDYSRRNWSGMFKGFYRPRWKLFIEEMSRSLNTGIPFDEQSVNEKILKWESKWSEGAEVYPKDPKENYLQISQNMFNIYQNLDF